MTTITAAAVRTAIESIRYELAPSAIDAMGLPAAEACDVFGDALLDVYPNASVTVVKSSVDASKMTARGEIDGAEFVLARDHFGSVSFSADPSELEVSVDGERSLDGDDQDVWERACKLAETRAAE